MLTTIPWRTALEHAQSPAALRRLAVNEREKMEEHDLRQRVTAAAQEYRDDTGEPHNGFKADTWFYPVTPRSTMSFYDVVLGWNHALVLAPLGRQLYAVQWILAYGKDNYHQVHGGVGVDVSEAGELDGWRVYQTRQKPMLRRVTTYNATSCSVSVVFQASGEGNLLISHIDSSPPLPWGIAFAWCGLAKERSIQLGPSELRNLRLRAIASICPERTELAKFADDTCLAGGTMSLSKPKIGKSHAMASTPLVRRQISTVALVRGVIPHTGLAPCEFNTQAGLVFERDRAPKFRVFLGNPAHLYVALVPLTVQQELGQLAGQDPTLQELQRNLRLATASLGELDAAMFVYNRATKRSALVDAQTDAQRLVTEMTQSVDAIATMVLQPLLAGAHGMAGLHNAVYNALQGTPFERARAIHTALVEQASVPAQVTRAEIARYFAVVDIPVTATAHQAFIDNV
jgi:hypothetical protein